jgi:hypothetical protein
MAFTAPSGSSGATTSLRPRLLSDLQAEVPTEPVRRSHRWSHHQGQALLLRRRRSQPHHLRPDPGALRAHVFCANQISPLAQKVVKLLPAPNYGVAGQTYNNYLFQGSASDNTTQYDVRVDWNASAKDQVFARYSSANQPQNFPSPFGILDGGGFGSDGQIQDKGRNFTASETHFFSPTLSNELRFGYNWINASYVQPSAGTDLSSQIGLGGIPFHAGNGGTPHVNITGLTSFGSPEYIPTNQYENVAQLLDNVSKTIHRHSFKAGVNFQRIHVQTLQPITSRGTYNFTGKFTQIPGNSSNTGFAAADFLADQMESASLSNLSTVHNQRWYPLPPAPMISPPTGLQDAPSSTGPATIASIFHSSKSSPSITKTASTFAPISSTLSTLRPTVSPTSISAVPSDRSQAHASEARASRQRHRTPA